MDANMRTIWINRALNVVAFCGVLVSAAMAAAAESAEIADQLIKAGVVPAKWAGVAAIIAIAGHIAAKYSKTPSQAIAAAMPPPKGPPPVGVFVLVLALAAALINCAHAAPVIQQCQGTVTPALIVDVGTALGEKDYEAAISKATVGVLPCLVVATVQEVIRSLDENSSVKAALAIDPDVVRMHGHEWLAVHGQQGRAAPAPRALL